MIGTSLGGQFSFEHSGNLDVATNLSVDLATAPYYADITATLILTMGQEADPIRFVIRVINPCNSAQFTHDSIDSKVVVTFEYDLGQSDYMINFAANTYMTSSIDETFVTTVCGGPELQWQYFHVDDSNPAWTDISSDSTFTTNS